MAQPLTDAITALTRYANEVTGQSDTNLSDAVRTLCDGYGGGGGSMPHFLDPSEQIGTITVDESNTLAVKTALASLPNGTTVVAFCETASKYKILLLYKRANSNISVSTGFTATGYGNTVFNVATWTDSNLVAGDVYYLFTGNNW